ncbi:hypothetical protein [Parafrankia sp. FMc2]|uniref:hypothetical protein n=1 Tax=Parafrankia sp. FMc2 TaxID=3233196 RepID=UPI0034D73F7D
MGGTRFRGSLGMSSPEAVVLAPGSAEAVARVPQGWSAAAGSFAGTVEHAVAAAPTVTSSSASHVRRRPFNGVPVTGTP